MAAGWVCASSFGCSTGALVDIVSTRAGAALAARGKDLAFQNDTDRRRKTTDPSQQPQNDSRSEAVPRDRRRRRGGSPEVGQALRAAYQQAVSEDIPPEMLDLLGKLG